MTLVYVGVGLLMLHTLAKTSEGWEQITRVKGGWQKICQGVPLGDELVHDLEGIISLRRNFVSDNLAYR